jgi:hypothetical protein
MSDQRTGTSVMKTANYLLPVSLYISAWIRRSQH